MMNKRIDAIDLLKAFSIYLVVWGHVLQHFLSSNHIDEPVYVLIYSFHMPLFMILSGYFSSSSMKLSFLDILKKKFTTLILPCIVWGVFLSIMYQTLIGKSLLSVRHIIDFIYTDFWFLKSVFLCYIIVWLGYRSKLPSLIWVCLTCILVQFYPHFQIPIMLPCFLVGMHIKKHINNELFTKYIYLYFFLFIVLFMIHKKEFFSGDYEKQYLMNGVFTVDLVKVLLYRIYKILMGVSGTLFIISITRKYFWDFDSTTSKLKRTICDYGKETLGIYIIHATMVSYILAKRLSLDIINPYLLNIIVAPVIALIILVLSYYCVRLICKSPKLSILLLGKNGGN